MLPSGLATNLSVTEGGPDLSGEGRWDTVDLPAGDLRPACRVSVLWTLADGKRSINALAVVAEEGEITPRGLHEVPLGAIMAAIDLAAILRAIDAFGIPAPVRPRFRKAGPKGYPPTFYALIAHRYRALRTGPAPIKTLAKGEGVSRMTVYTWLKRARELGFLEEGEAYE